MAEQFHAGQRVHLEADVLGFHTGDTGRVLRLDHVPGGRSEAVVYWCEMAAVEGPRLGAFYPEEIQPAT
jgi:hypothetical protein